MTSNTTQSRLTTSTIPEEDRSVPQASRLTHSQSQTERQCPECNGQIIAKTAHTATEYRCQECGLVVDESQTQQALARSRTDSNSATIRTSGRESPALTGSNRTKVGRRNRDGTGKALSVPQRERARRLRRQQLWDTSHAEQAADAGTTEIKRMGTAVGVSTPAIETASVIFNRAVEDHLLKGHSIESMAGGALFAAAKTHTAPVTLQDITVVSKLTEKNRLYRSYMRLQRELGLEIEPVHPAAFVGQLRSAAGLGQAYESRARTLLEDVSPHVFSGVPPRVSAATALYAAGITDPNLPLVEQAALCRDISVSRRAIRNNYRTLLSETDVWRPQAPTADAPHTSLDTLIAQADTPRALKQAIFGEPTTHR